MNKLLLTFILGIFLLSFTSAATKTCWQDNATATTCGASAGAYGSEAIDANHVYLLANYTVPLYATNNTNLTISRGYTQTIPSVILGNYTVNPTTDCLNNSDGMLQLRFNIGGSSTVQDVIASCYNGATWTTLFDGINFNTNYTDCTADTGLEKGYDMIWNSSIAFYNNNYYYNCHAPEPTPTGLSGFHEEGILWVMEDTNFPQVNINYPVNESVYSEVKSINYGATDTNIDSCWYSLNGGANTIVTCGQSISLSGYFGNNTIIIYANDTFGNINSSAVTFSVTSKGTIVNNTMTQTSIHTPETMTNYDDAFAVLFDSNYNTGINSSTYAGGDFRYTVFGYSIPAQATNVYAKITYGDGRKNATISCDDYLRYDFISASAFNVSCGNGLFNIINNPTPTLSISSPNTNDGYIYETEIIWDSYPPLQNGSTTSWEENANLTFTSTQSPTGWFSWLVNSVEQLSGIGQNVFNYVFSLPSTSPNATVVLNSPTGWLNLTDRDGTYGPSINDYGIAYDSNNDLVYLSGSGSKFKVYNPKTKAVMTDLTSLITWNSALYSLAYDKNNNLVYTGHQSPSWSGFGVYNITAGTWANLSETDTGDWASGSYVVYMAYDYNSNLVYTAGLNGKFGVYNRTSNVWTNLSTTDAGDWVGTSLGFALAFDNDSNLIYTGNDGGKFGVYNRTSNVWTDLSATDAGDWASTSPVRSLVYADGLIYVGLNGKFGVYNRTSNVWTDLSATDAANWAASSYVLALTHDTTNDLIYTGMTGGLGVYNPNTNVWTDLRDTDVGGWAGIQAPQAIVYRPTNNEIYTGLTTGLFGLYRTTGDFDNETFYINTNSVNPNINIVYPVNGVTYNQDTNIPLNYSLTELNPNVCKYSINGGANTTITCGQNVSDLGLESGSYTLTLYVNDSVGNTNSSTISFVYNKLAYNSSNTIHQCGKIISAGTYTLNQTINKTSAGSCLNITSDNIILNGNQKKIIYGSVTSESGLLLYNNITNFTLTNTIVDCGAVGCGVGLEFLGAANNIVIENNTINNTLGGTTAILVNNGNLTGASIKNNTLLNSYIDTLVISNANITDNIAAGAGLFQTQTKAYNVTLQNNKFGSGIYILESTDSQVIYSNSLGNITWQIASGSNELRVAYHAACPPGAFGLTVFTNYRLNLSTIRPTVTDFVRSNKIWLNGSAANNINVTNATGTYAIATYSSTSGSWRLYDVTAYGTLTEIQIYWGTSNSCQGYDIWAKILGGLDASGNNLDWDGGNTGNIQIKNGSIYVNSTSLTGLDFPASLVMSKPATNYIIPRVLSDKLICTSCTNTTNLNSVLAEFTVPGFSNYTIGDEPSISVTSPVGMQNYLKLGTNFTLNFTATDSNLDKCWYNYNGTNQNATCSNATLASFNIPYTGVKSIAVYANDTDGNIGNTNVTWDYALVENNYTYNSTGVYETDAATFTLNSTINSSLWSSITGVFVLNGVPNSATQSSGQWTSTFDVPEGAGNKSAYWSLTFSNVTNTYIANTTLFNQTVLETRFILCNSTPYNTTFLNITFKDEATFTNINGSEDLLDVDYYLSTGSGTVKKNYLYANATLNGNYAFCGMPSGRTIRAHIKNQYASTGYPQRTKEADYTLTSSVTNDVLYLLGGGTGQYVTFTVYDQSTFAIQGATVKAYRDILGVSTLITEGVTDAAGVVTFWLNPNYAHTISATKPGCTALSTSITPTQSQYTIQTSCSSTGNATNFQDPGENILWTRAPLTGPVNTDGPTLFTYAVWVTSSDVEIVGAKFEIRNSTNLTLLASNTTLVSEGKSYCNSVSCAMMINYNVTRGADLKGFYYVDTGNGWMLLEGDAHWIFIPINATNTGNSLTSALSSLLDFLSNWGQTDNSLDAVEQNKIEFSKILLAFLIGAILLAIAGRYSGYDASNPGIFMGIVAAYVLILSSVNGPTGEGFFYFSHLAPDTWGAGAHFLNNYIFALTSTFIAIGVGFMYARRT